MYNLVLRLYCEHNGHVPKDIDPTGGDPRMGGPVAITICDRCSIELPHSEDAKQYNKMIDQWKERIAREEEAKHVVVKLNWWKRVINRRTVACSCGWSGHTFEVHRSSAGLAKAWSR